MRFYLILLSIPAFFFLAERVFAARPQRVLRRGIWADLVYAPVNVMFRLVLNGTLAVALAELGRRTLPPACVDVLAARPAWVQLVVMLLVLDFFFYWMHRLKHRWRWWWRLHETHHSSVDMDFFSSVRFHPLEKILDRTVYLLPLTVLGPGPEAIAAWAVVDTFFGMFIHANLDWRIGPLIYVFVGPEMHRWHHVRDPGVRECNYGNNFSVFDWLFGTAYLSPKRAGNFGVDDAAYPVGNFFRQLVYAFRPLPPRVDEPGEGVPVSAESESA